MNSRSLAAVTTFVLLAGCARQHPTAPVAAADPRPVADSPANAVRRLEWGWANRDTIAAAGGMTTDYLFVFGEADSSGNAYRDRPWGLSDEARCVRHMFHGGGSMPPVSDIQIDFDKTLTPMDDPRPGHEGQWHQEIFTHVDLKITLIDTDGTPEVIPVTGNAVFFLTRGDSALAPAGSPRDSNHWYIDDWEDHTITTGVPGFGTLPTRSYSWGQIKALYW